MNSLLNRLESDRKTSEQTREESPLAFLANGYPDPARPHPPSSDDLMAMAVELAASMRARKA